MWQAAQAAVLNSFCPSPARRRAEASSGTRTNGRGSAAHNAVSWSHWYWPRSWPGGRPCGEGCRLGVPGVAQAQLAGARRLHEIGQVARLRLPAEPAHAPVGQEQGAPGRTRPRLLGLRAAQDDPLGDRVDQARAEQGGRVPLRDVDPAGEPQGGQLA